MKFSHLFALFSGVVFILVSLAYFSFSDSGVQLIGVLRILVPGLLILFAFLLFKLYKRGEAFRFV